MIKNREKGNVNIILIIFILLAISAIVFLFFQDNTSSNNISEFENISGEDGTVSTQHDDSTITNNNSQDVVKLSNNITGNQQINTSNTNNSNTSNGNTNEYTRYFYSQLNSSAKQMYSALENNKDVLIDGYGGIDFNINMPGLDKSFQSAWDAISLDKPSLFYVDTAKISLLSKTTTNLLGKETYSYKLQPKSGGNYFISTWKNSSEVKSAINRVNSVIQQIVNGAPNSSKRYDYIKYVHDYLINTIDYNQGENPNNGDIYGALINRKCVCEGYAKAFKQLMDEKNVPCVIVFGKASDEDGNSEVHAWNYVMLEDGKWYAIDTTWDDPIIVGRGKIPESVKYKYFLKGSSSFFKSHFEDPDVSGSGQNFKYPVLSETDY